LLLLANGSTAIDGFSATLPRIGGGLVLLSGMSRQFGWRLEIGEWK